MSSIQNAVDPLRRVLVRSPREVDLANWQAYNWRSAPDPAGASEEHRALRSLLEDAGAEVLLGEPVVEGDPDSIYPYDPSIVTDAGAITFRPGKEGRRDEQGSIERDLVAAGIPILGRLTAPATAEGGDMFFLDERTLIVGRTYRTNDAGIEQIRALVEPNGIEVLAYDIVHQHGPEHCVHTMTFISMLDRDLAVGFVPMLPIRLVELLKDRGVQLVEVPEAELDSQGPNVLALAPRLALALEGNQETKRRMEAAGVEVRTYLGAQISLKGDGGATCLTRPLARG